MQVMLPSGKVFGSQFSLHHSAANQIMIQIFLNGNSELLGDNPNLESLLLEKKLIQQTGIAVAVNGKVFSREQWPATRLNDKDQVLIITASQGG